MTYEAQLLLQVQRHGDRCGTFSRVKVSVELAPCLGGYGQPREFAGGLTRSHASNRERTVISKTVRRLTGSTTWTGGAAAERSDVLRPEYLIGWLAGRGRAGQTRLSRPGHCIYSTPASAVHDLSRFAIALDSWREHPGDFAHRLLKRGLKKIALQVVRASHSRLARRSLTTVVTVDARRY